MKTVQSSLQGETHNQYRNRVGRISRHQHLMSQKVDPSQRREEIKRFSEASKKIERKMKMEVERIAKGAPSFRQKQIAHDKARGAYESQSPVTDSEVHHRREEVEASA